MHLPRNCTSCHALSHVGSTRNCVARIAFNPKVKGGVTPPSLFSDHCPGNMLRAPLGTRVKSQRKAGCALWISKRAMAQRIERICISLLFLLGCGFSRARSQVMSCLSIRSALAVLASLLIIPWGTTGWAQTELAKSATGSSQTASVPRHVQTATQLAPAEASGTQQSVISSGKFGLQISGQNNALEAPPAAIKPNVGPASGNPLLPVCADPTSLQCGTPILFAHGICEHPDSWNQVQGPIASYLAANYRNLYPDQNLYQLQANGPLASDVTFYSPQGVEYIPGLDPPLSTNLRYFAIGFVDPVCPYCPPDDHDPNSVRKAEFTPGFLLLNAHYHGKQERRLS